MSEDRRVKRRIARAIGGKGILLLACVFATALFVPINPVRAQPVGKYFDNTVIIVMENEGICNIMGSVLGCSPNLAPYETSLAQTWSLATHYTSVDNTTSSPFSLKNYLALFSGQTWGCTSDDNPNSSTCTQNAWNSVNQNLVDRLPSSITWKAYMENMTSNCQTTDSSTYSAHHDPFVYFNDIVGNPTRCGQVVPAGTNGSLDSTLLNDLNSGSAANLMWLTPNLCDDMHNTCTGPGNQTSTGYCGSNNNTLCVPEGDSYLKHLVPNILSSYTFTHNRAALFITYDEGNGFCPNTPPPSSDDCVYAVWAGPVAAKPHSSSITYMPGHYSWLATLEDNWGFRGSCLGHDCPPVPVLSEFFIPSVGLSLSLSTIYQPFYQGTPLTEINTTRLTVTGFNGFSGLVTVIISPYNSDPGRGPVAQLSTYPYNKENFTLTLNGQASDNISVYSCRATPRGVWMWHGSIIGTMGETILWPTSTTATPMTDCRGHRIFERPLRDPTTCVLKEATLATITGMITCGSQVHTGLTVTRPTLLLR